MGICNSSYQLSSRVMKGVANSYAPRVKHGSNTINTAAIIEILAKSRAAMKITSIVLSKKIVMISSVVRFIQDRSQSHSILYYTASTLKVLPAHFKIFLAV